MSTITVASWNMHHAVDHSAASHAAAWAYLADAIRPTIALVQEAAGTPDAPGSTVRSTVTGLRHPFDTAVVGYGVRVDPVGQVQTKYSAKKPFDVMPRDPGGFAAGRVSLTDETELVAISMYGLLEKGLYAQTSILRAIADLIPFFDQPGLGSRYVVLAGDLNVYDQTIDRVMRERWTAILGLFERLGLVNLLKATAAHRTPCPGCPCGHPDCWHVETFRQLSATGPGCFTTDYIFASPALTERLQTFKVWSGREHETEVRSLSDHFPLVATFDLARR